MDRYRVAKVRDGYAVKDDEHTVVSVHGTRREARRARDRAEAGARAEVPGTPVEAAGAAERLRAAWGAG